MVIHHIPWSAPTPVTVRELVTKLEALMVLYPEMADAWVESAAGLHTVVTDVHCYDTSPLWVDHGIVSLRHAAPYNWGAG